MSGALLVVEDDVDLRDMLSLVLAARGFQVESASNGVDALARLSRAPAPSLVLLDLRMPTLNGTELLERLGELKVLESVPVIVMSGEPGGERTAMGRGAAAFLGKPFGIDELLQVIERLIPPEPAPAPLS